MEQKDIRELARARRLVTRELYPFNAFYGHADLLRRYAGIAGSRPLKVTIEHGPALSPNPSDPDLESRLPRYFCASAEQARFFDEHARHEARAEAVGAPIHYAMALAPPSAPTSRRLLFFAAHSSDFATAVYSVDAAAARLHELRDEFEEVVVCLYWRDVLLGRAELYERHGFRCVTAGHMFDPQFLFRLIAVISSASTVLTDRLGSHLLYALVLDRPVWLERWPVEYELAASAPPGTIGPQEDALLEQAVGLFGGRAERIDAGQRAFADGLCGTAHVRPPAELAELLAEAEAAYRTETPRSVRLQLQATSAARYLWNVAHW